MSASPYREPPASAATQCEAYVEDTVQQWTIERDSVAYRLHQCQLPAGHRGNHDAGDGTRWWNCRERFGVR